MAQPPRILLWHWGRRGGGPRYTYELARALAGLTDRGDLHLSLSRQSESYAETAALGLPSLDVDTYTSASGLALGTLRLPGIVGVFEDYLRANRIDVVLCTMVHLWNVACLGALKRAGARYVFTVHDAVAHPGEENRLRTWALRRELAAADHVVTLSEHVRSELARVHGVPPQRVDVIPHGVFDYFPGQQARTWSRQRPLRLLFFGRLMPYKGLPILAEAMRLLAGAPVELAVVGPGQSEPWTTLFQGMPNVRMDIRWVPESEMQAVVGAADAVVQPYVEASQSGVVPVAFSAGMPCIVTPVGGLAEQVRHEQSGLVCADQSPRAVAAAIRRLLDEPGLYDRLSQGALQAARTDLSWDAIARRTRDLLDKVAQTRAGGQG